MNREIELPARVSELPVLQDAVGEMLKEKNCSGKVTGQIQVSVEEIFVNIASYAYGPEGGKVRIRFGMPEDGRDFSITFMDWGRPFNPLERDDPDVALSAGSRQIGGLGIFLTKKLMDQAAYEYRDGANVLTLRKRI